MSKNNAYKLQIAIRTGRTASDLLMDGSITPADFGYYHIMHRESTWGYINRTNPKAMSYWVDKFQCTISGAYKILDRLAKHNLIYKMPNKARNKPVFLIFEEALTAEEIAHYLNILAENPTWKHIKYKDAKFLRRDASENSTAENQESETRPTDSPSPAQTPQNGYRPKYKFGKETYNGDEWYYGDGGNFTKKTEGRNVGVKEADVPQAVKEMFFDRDAETNSNQ